RYAKNEKPVTGVPQCWQFQLQGQGLQPLLPK
ncbi:hypothetical protein M2447_001316, partial [Ereboglobus sp. PH5-10]|nr:hypothetical protein [Ereboglobus sp. PH5-10]